MLFRVIIPLLLPLGATASGSTNTLNRADLRTGTGPCNESFPLAPPDTQNHHRRHERRLVAIRPGDESSKYYETGEYYAPLCPDGRHIDIRKLQRCNGGSCWNEEISQCTFQCTWDESTPRPSVSPIPSNLPSKSSPFSSNIDRQASASRSPVDIPSVPPSTNGTRFIKRECNQVLEVEKSEEYNEVQVGIYQLLMQSYTAEFGFMVSTPQIVTTCEVITQELAGGRRLLSRLLQTPKTLLIMKFTMEYESRYGYDVEDYPRQFQTYINSNLEKVTADMNSRFLPVINAQEVIIFATSKPTASPSQIRGNHLPSMIPSSPSEDMPTYLPSVLPSASILPSDSPSFFMAPTPAPTINVDIVEDRTSFIVGLAAGLSGAAIIVLVLIWYMRRKSQQKEHEVAAANARGNQPNSSRMEEGIEIGAAGAMPGRMPSSAHDSHHSAQFENYPEDNGGPSSPQEGVGTIADSIFSNPSMVSGGGSFSSHSDDNHQGVPVNTLQDEFEAYKNQGLEIMRSGVEESVYGAEGMMSLAMTRALMEDEDAEIIPSWGGAEDPESIEANGLCETNDWLRKHDHSTTEERNQFFQEILNKMVTTVRRGMISPSNGTRAIHCCASMLGLQLEKEQPNNVLLVHGMRKTNDLTLGRSFLVEAFEVFGDIEGAAIAPNNRGFGFVRFVSPKSVQRALERFRISEIEVQDVSVMIKSLKSDSQAV